MASARGSLREKGKKQVLTNEEIIKLTNLIIKIENHYGFPVDVEWAREKGKFYIVQSRPITTLADKVEATSLSNTKILSKYRFDDYVRMFAGKSYYYIFSDIFLQHYNSLGVLSVQDSEHWMSFLPKISKQKTLEEGKKIYMDKKRFDEYNKDFHQYIKDASKYFESTLDKPKLNAEEVRKFLDLASKHFFYYAKTEFFYTDLVDQEKMVISVAQFDKLKLDGRSYLNKIFFAGDGYLMNLIKKISKQKGVSESDLFFYDIEEFIELVKNKAKIDSKKIKDRHLFFHSKEDILFGEDSKKLAEKFISRYQETSDVIKGSIANKGKVQGKARVFSADFKNFDKLALAVKEMEKGEILIAESTAPEIIAACKKAAAIVTNQGGMLSHAAIVSRELGIPCIIGTDKNVVLNIHTGDLVEVDADKGVVRILERANEKFEDKKDIETKMNQISWFNHISRDMSLTAIWYPYNSYTNGLKMFYANGPNMVYFSNNGFIKGYKDIAGQEITYNGIKKVVSKGKLKDILIKFEGLIKQREVLINKFCSVDLSKKSFDWIKNKVTEFHEFYKTYWNYHIFCFNLGEALIKSEFEKLLKDNQELIYRVRQVNPYLIFDEKFLPHIYNYISKKENIEQKLLFYLIPKELLNYLDGSMKLDFEELQRRQKYYFLADLNAREYFYSGENAFKKYNEIIPKDEHISEIIEFKGSVAFSGKVKGIVSIVKLKEDLYKIKDGSILVTQQTTPEFTPYLKKVIGIITDEGGIASHAAIISREMKIPCVIGTKIATQVLHDSDLVEVDADNGVVRIIEKSTESLANDPTFIDGKKWNLIISRSMNFWHQYLSNLGHFHNTKDFGIDGNLEILTLTVDGRHTSAFNNQVNSNIINQKIMDLICIKEGIEQIKKYYKKYAKELLKNLNICKNKLTVKNWDGFQKSYQRFGAGLYFTVIIGRGGQELLSNKLKNLGYNDSDITEILSKVTYPKEHTPLFNSQIDMLEIGKKIQNKKIKNNEIKKELKVWLKKYQHIPVNFNEEPWTDDDSEKQLSDFLKKDCISELENLKNNHLNKIKNKEELLKKINNKEISIISNAIAEGTYLNEFRKNIFSKVSLEYRDIFKIIAKKGNSDNWRDVYYLTPPETLNLLSGNKFSIADKIKERKYVLMYPNSSGEMVFANQEKTNAIADYLALTYSKGNNNQNSIENEIRGFSANKGKVNGIVKIILTSKDFNKINRGDILVTPMTSVDFVPIMEKAAAFVTNEGGITSHASIMSREMNKPCIIGTKIATQVLKDGDLVEVDADNGIVKILKRQNGK